MKAHCIKCVEEGDTARGVEGRRDVNRLSRRCTGSSRIRIRFLPSRRTGRVRRIDRVALGVGGFRDPLADGWGQSRAPPSGAFPSLSPGREAKRGLR